ncbi:RNA-binding ATPase activator esf2 [Recurvomyces mirabilis]|nr:RNA-binding ATPase activator esf2 [Recurvomyces mirabilis]
MVVRKRNEFLEGDESEDDLGGGYGSDESEAGRGGIGGRVSKRQKREVDSDEESLASLADEESVSAAYVAAQDGNASKPGAERFLLGSDFEDEDEHDAPAVDASVEDAPAKKRMPKSVAAAEKAARRSGVIYISRVPPFMKPQTLRHFLVPHASKGLGRIFLTPEDHTAHLQRVKRGGNKKKSFTDGWVEFTSKAEAKIAAEMLNGNIIGGKKGNFYHDDLWNIKYLNGFKWSHLTDQIAGENAEREARMREEVRRTKEENKAFVDDIERGKMLEGMESKRRAKREKGLAATAAPAVKPVRPGRDFEQRKARGTDSRGEGDQSADQKRVLSMIM